MDRGGEPRGCGGLRNLGKSDSGLQSKGALIAFIREDSQSREVESTDVNGRSDGLSCLKMQQDT